MIIPFPFDLEADIRSHLDRAPYLSLGNPAPDHVLPTTYFLHVISGRDTLAQYEWRGFPLPFPIKASSLHRRRVRFLLVVKIWISRYAFVLRRRRIPSQSISGFLVAVPSEKVRAWIKYVQVTLPRQSRKTSRTFTKSRPARPNPEVVTQHHTNYYKVGSAAPSQSGGDNPTVYRRTWTGSRTPGFGALKRRFLPVNNHTVDLQSNLDGGYTQVLQDDVNPENASVFITSWQTGFGGYTGTPQVPAHLPATANVALNRLVDRMGSALDANIAQDFAQFGQLTSLIGSTATRLTGSLRALRRKDIDGAIGALWNGTSRNPRFRQGNSPSRTNSLARNWLELQYGWKPLLMDIDGLMRSLAQLQNASEHTTRVVSASASLSSNRGGPITAYPGVNQGAEGESLKTRVKFQVHYKIDSNLKAFLAQTGFTNPLNLAWEVLPYSFVVDWFLPIGDYLQSFSNFDGLQFISGCKTTFTRQLYNGYYSYSGSAPQIAPWQVIHVYGNYQRERVLLTREALIDFPRPNLPRFKNPLTATHALNALALMRTAFAR